MGRLIDLTNKKFGRLSVVRRGENDKRGEARWVCLCECGNTTVVNGYNLRKGITKSCGCYGRKRTSETKKTHGLTKTRIYGIWNNMKDRCYNTNNEAFERYGGKGISVCDSWKNDFSEFYKWAMENGYREDLTIDRIDNKKGYSPENCRWATTKEQSNNRENVHEVTYKGKTQTLSEWADELNIPYEVLYKRFYKGMPLDKVFDTEIKTNNQRSITYNGETKNIRQWAKEKGIPYKTLHKRIMDGWDIKKALETKDNPLHNQITYNGKTQTIADWARELNINYDTLKQRLNKYNWPVEKAFKTPVK
ncbi:putative transcriptional regulator [Anoxybacillus kamchatkensis]|uniref:hypothetical protein n=1 Tax=Anoxybacillus ayderensis TaxID=265546 RepID=UPI0015EC9F10|nr:hypothetical protein [Anoxybacillus ayderensis]MBA2878048.1 putative transcriptional regulator [Anoxybacillus ayderensis]